MSTSSATNPFLTTEHDALREMVADFAAKRIEPAAEEWDREHTFPVDVVLEMGELGLFGIPFPEPYGFGGDFLSLCVAIEELGRVDQSMAITLEAGSASGPTRSPSSATRSNASGGSPTSAPGGRSAASDSPSPTPAVTPAARARRRGSTATSG